MQLLDRTKTNPFNGKLPGAHPMTVDDDVARLWEVRLYCAACGHLITAARWGISMDGAHEHCCFNPLGVQYDIRLFRRAPGVESVGAATLRATWFSGYTWRLVACNNCREHLGWHYEGRRQPTRFYGLIAEKLTETGSPEDPPAP